MESYLTWEIQKTWRWQEQWKEVFVPCYIEIKTHPNPIWNVQSWPFLWLHTTSSSVLLLQIPKKNTHFFSLNFIANTYYNIHSFSTQNRFQPFTALKEETIFATTNSAEDGEWILQVQNLHTAPNLQIKGYWQDLR